MKSHKRAISRFQSPPTSAVELLKAIGEMHHNRGVRIGVQRWFRAKAAIASALEQASESVSMTFVRLAQVRTFS